jgi:hypothetical protein
MGSLLNLKEILSELCVIFNGLMPREERPYIPPDSQARTISMNAVTHVLAEATGNPEAANETELAASDENTEMHEIEILVDGPYASMMARAIHDLMERHLPIAGNERVFSDLWSHMISAEGPKPSVSKATNAVASLLRAMRDQETQQKIQQLLQLSEDMKASFPCKMSLHLNLTTDGDIVPVFADVTLMPDAGLFEALRNQHGIKLAFCRQWFVSPFYPPYEEGMEISVTTPEGSAAFEEAIRPRLQNPLTLRPEPPDPSPGKS